MTISELVKALQVIQIKQGDIQVAVESPSGSWHAPVLWTDAKMPHIVVIELGEEV